MAETVLDLSELSLAFDGIKTFVTAALEKPSGRGTRLPKSQLARTYRDIEAVKARGHMSSVAQWISRMDRNSTDQVFRDDCCDARDRARLVPWTMPAVPTHSSRRR